MYLRVLLPFALWVVWCLLLVDWDATRSSLKQGGWVGLVLVGLLAVLVWGSLSPEAPELLPLPLPNYVEEFTIVFGLVVVMLGCGALQLALRPPRKGQ